MKTASRSSAVLIVVLLLTACWPHPGQGPDRNAHNPNETGVNTTTVGNLQQVWSTTLDRAAANDPIVSGGSLFVHTLTGLYGIDITTGNVNWNSAPTTGRYYSGAAVAVDDRVLVTDGHFTLGWNARWHDSATGDVVSAADPAILDTVRGDVLALQSPAILGDTAWWSLRLVNTASSAVWSGLVSIQDTFPVPVTLGTSHAYHVGNGTLDTQPGGGTSGEGIRAFPVTGAATNCGPPELAILACPSWAVPLTAPPAGPAVIGADGATVFVASTDGVLQALDATTGALLWWSNLGERQAAASPAVAEGNVFVPTTTGELVVLAEAGCAQSPCAPLWISEVGDRLNHQPAVAGTGDTAVVFTTASSGELRAFAAAGCDLTVCAPLWTGAAGAQVNHPPAVSDGRMFVTTSDGRIVAYALPPEP